MKIKSLTLYTRNLEKQIDFYGNTLGLKQVSQAEGQASFQVGKSILNLVQRDQATPYHFAINIPGNQVNEALTWLKQRVVILKYGTDEIQDFSNWNAKAIYFYDKDQNIVELIARKNLEYGQQENFSAYSLLEISEIGMPVDDIKTAYEALQEKATFEIFDGGFDRFCAIGDEYGLFICINKHLKDWFPTGDKAHSSAFEIQFEQKDQAFQLAFTNGEIKESFY